MHRHLLLGTAAQGRTAAIRALCAHANVAEPKDWDIEFSDGCPTLKTIAREMGVNVSAATRDDMDNVIDVLCRRAFPKDFGPVAERPDRAGGESLKAAIRAALASGNDCPLCGVCTDPAQLELAIEVLRGKLSGPEVPALPEPSKEAPKNE